MVTEELDNLGAAEMCVQSEPDLTPPLSPSSSSPSVPSTESERAPPKGACFWPVTANVRPIFSTFPHILKLGNPWHPARFSIVHTGPK